jgi:hypothetical protein
MLRLHSVFAGSQKNAIKMSWKALGARAAVAQGRNQAHV